MPDLTLYTITFDESGQDQVHFDEVSPNNFK